MIFNLLKAIYFTVCIGQLPNKVQDFYMHSILDILFTTIERWITRVDLRIAKETLLRDEP